MKIAKYIVRRVKGELNAEQQQNWRKRQNVISVNRMTPASRGATIASTVPEVVWKVYQNALGMRVGEQQKLKEFDLSNPLVQAKLKERYGKIFRLRKR